MLTRLLNLHPGIGVTFEFRPLLALDKDPVAHWSVVRKDPWRRRIVETPQFGDWRVQARKTLLQRVLRGVVDRMASARFLRRYRARLPGNGRVTLDAVREGYRSFFGQDTVVGDKYPEYIFSLDALVRQAGLKIIVIYRDPRDVAGSVLRMLRAGWSGGPWGNQLSTPAGIAESWAQAAGLTREHRERCHVVRYESMVADPEQAAQGLSQFLGVAVEGFRTELVHGGSVGRGFGELSAEQIAVIEGSAAQEMESLGYGLRGPARAVDGGDL